VIVVDFFVPMRQDTAEVVKKFMARDPENLRFTVVALCKAA